MTVQPEIMEAMAERRPGAYIPMPPSEILKRGGRMCRACSTLKLPEAFYRYKSGKLRSRCMECMSSEQAERRSKLAPDDPRITRLAAYSDPERNRRRAREHSKATAILKERHADEYRALLREIRGRT